MRPALALLLAALAVAGVAPAWAQATGKATLSWTDNSAGPADEDSFEIERKPAGGAYAPLGTVGRGVTSYSDQGLTLGAAYCWRVRARNAGGASAYSGEACATIAAVPPPPGGLTVIITIVP